MSGVKSDINESVVDFWAGEIESDFPTLSTEKLTSIILEGIKGKLSAQPNFGIGLSTIYSWINEKHREEGKSYAELMTE